MAIDAKLMEILACPDCKTRVIEVEDAIYCMNGQCRRKYSITDNIPVMLIEESEVLDPDAWAAVAKPAE